MKLKVELESGETIEQAEDFLEKSLKTKKECSDERYSSEYLNEFHEYVCQTHGRLVSNIFDQIKAEIDAHTK